MQRNTALADLQPRPLGEQWQHYHGVSIYGAVRRAWRINQLQRCDLRHVLGLTLRADEDLLEKSLKSAAMGDRLRALYPDLEDRIWSVADWWPFSGRVPTEYFSERLRECPACARSSYHSLLFQMPGITRCPLHALRLIDACPSCKRRLGEGLRHGLPPGRCPCGHDLVDDLTSVTGDGAGPFRWLHTLSYLEWAEKIRPHYWLLPPEAPDSRGWEALARLLPAFPSYLRQRIERSSDNVVVIEDVTVKRFGGLTPRLGEHSGLETFRPGTSALPLSWFPAFRDIGNELWHELVTTSGGAEALESGDLRPALMELPAYACGKKMLLQTECLDRTVLRTVGHLANAMSRPKGGLRFPQIEAFSRWLRSHPLGVIMAEKVLQRLLQRGYAHGTRIALGRHVPDLYRKTNRPVNRYPWIALHVQPGSTPSARIAWSRQGGTF